MKILHVCSYYITSKLYKNLVEKLEEEGFYNEVYIPINSQSFENKYIGKKSDKTNYIYSNCFNKIDRVSFNLKNNKIYSDLNEKVDLDSIDVVHAHSLFVNGYVAYKLKRDKNIDYIVAVRNTDVNTFFKKMIHLRKLGIDILKNAKKIIFISSRYQDFVIDNYIPEHLKEEIKQKSIVVPNGIDEFWFNNLELEPKIIKKNNIKLIYVGKLDKNKNIRTSIEVINKLNKMGYNATLDIVGDGPEFTKLKELENRAEYKNKITLYGYMEKEDIMNLYRKNDIFIMPSKYETFGLVYIEAITQGLPVIYTRGQGFDGYFDEGTVGYGVKYDDVEEITDSILKIFEKEIWNFKDIEEELKGSFDWKNVALEYKKIYCDIKNSDSVL
ncbi:glycosyltransferase family 4 protein [Metaclostridioides mangenotii]|uniref:glycosyltransferase family 4 protein n=1 Tax=Metaclostridioides mangenotii TaxID=1540 RepID=UPI0028EB79A7|nr:glycosyltransferase family 4 protein [Clostridioides mangenotii]